MEHITTFHSTEITNDIYKESYDNFAFNILEDGAYKRIGGFTIGYGNQIFNIEIFENYRRKGWATKMLQEAFKILEQNGEKTCCLSVKRDNTAAVNLYVKIRFYCQVSSKTHLFMVKNLL